MDAITLSLLFDEPLIPQLQSRSAPMAECLPRRAKGARPFLGLAQTQRLRHTRRCGRLQAQPSRSVSPTLIGRHASIARSVVALTRRRLELEIPRRTTLTTLRPYPQSVILRFVPVSHSQSEARLRTRQWRELFDNALPYESLQLHRRGGVARRGRE